jgi:hypothetical protein
LHATAWSQREIPEEEIMETTEESERLTSRRSFLVKGATAGAGILGGGRLLAAASPAFASGGLTRGDAAILRFLAAVEAIEADLWQQYNELAGIQDREVPGGSGNRAYTEAVAVLDEDMDQYIHDNTDDEFSHFAFIEAGGTSLYPSLAQRVTHKEALRILLSIGGSETMHFQTWHDKAGNAPPLTDPTNGLVFPDLNADGEITQTT